ncbi:uncharacterized protein LOC135934232 [Cloeon dipterum]|uniref:uncharacterized protein LOC135934232 n=1 Tax=Cloeon dipterum TaxID=197152 RepID=UPI0032203792
MLVWFLFVLSLISFQNGLCGDIATVGNETKCEKPNLNEDKENKVYLCRGATDNDPGQFCKSKESKDAKNYCALCHTAGSVIDLLKRKVSCDCSNRSNQLKLSCNRNHWQKLDATSNGVTIMLDQENCKCKADDKWMYIIIGIIAVLTILVVVAIVICCIRCKRSRAGLYIDNAQVTRNPIML